MQPLHRNLWTTMLHWKKCKTLESIILATQEAYLPFFTYFAHWVSLTKASRLHFAREVTLVKKKSSADFPSSNHGQTIILFLPFHDWVLRGASSLAKSAVYLPTFRKSTPLFKAPGACSGLVGLSVELSGYGSERTQKVLIYSLGENTQL